MSEYAWTWGYGTNGFADHPLDAALDVMQGCGYGAVALTLGHPHLDPFAPDWRARTEHLATDLGRRGLRSVVETGARYLLDPWTKHRPTLVDREADARMEFLRRAIEIAGILGSDCVSLWSGVLPDDVTADAARVLLDERLAALVESAADRDVVLALEPEPGMLVETVEDALAVRARLGHPANLGLTVDLGHCVVVERAGVVGALRAAGSLLRNVQADDMRATAHEHLPFGEGDLDLEAALRTLREIDYRGVVAVELPRHSHAAPKLARESIIALEAAAGSAMPGAASAVRDDAPSRRATSDHPWTARAVDEVRADATRAARRFAEAGRAVGREPRGKTPFGPTADDEARAAIVAALVDGGAEPAILESLYRRGDDAERRGVLRGLDRVSASVDDRWRETGIEIVNDALRTNDARLVAAAMGPFAGRHLDDHAWRHGVLKLVFLGIPLSVVDALADRADEELAAMAERFAVERRAAGRPVPDDLTLVLPTSERF
ncbi:EboA domain-containing protein [Microbacterium sp. ACRRU]|uniref:EboA domain-containing protein n=1 Tax=Microbacterium sp. ACRRU TaxID=2918204 RepID=UPI001EF61084|nr:EboA domain-containing protein [Microbacterium sp. ACRRU]MCG7417775.1 EboA domain-containing protein [Microbacterium sp. ACRRU]